MMNEILKEHAILCETIGGKFHSSKSVFFAWQWVIKNGTKVLKHIEKDMKVREERMKNYDNEQSVQTLGIFMSPTLNWDRQFQDINIKMEESIGKLSSTLMKVQLTHLCVNSHFMSKVYFGYGIMSITDA